MKKLLLVLLFAPMISFGQLQPLYDKEFAVYYGKFFLMDKVLGLPDSNDYSKFQISPLAASSSREITTIYYKSVEKNKEGLVIGFFDEYWNQSGVTYRGYAFKELNLSEATILINKIDTIIDSEKRFLNAEDDVNNIYFKFKDITVLIYRAGPLSGRIRLFWNNFDAEWNNLQFKKTKKRFERAAK